MFNLNVYCELKSKDQSVDDNRKAVSAYLDSVDYKMPKPQYKHDHGDKTTWRFVDHIVLRDKFLDIVKCGWVLNPDFKFGGSL